MSDPLARFRRFLRELKRRNVYRVAVTYAVVAFVIWQVADQLFPALGFPGWTTDFVVVLTLLGFPIALVLAWAFEMTAEGVRRTPELAEGEAAEETPGPALGHRRKKGVLAGLAAGAIVLAVVGIWMATGGTGERTAGSGDGVEEYDASRVAVLPFAVRGSAELAYLGDGMVDLLSTALDGAGELRTVDPFAVLSVTEGAQVETVTPARGSALAHRLGAGHYVIGSVIDAGGRLRFRAALYQSDGNLVADAETRVSGESELYEAVDELARRLIAAGGGDAALRTPALAARTTSSLPALKAYLEGEGRFRAGRWAEAIEPLQRAVALDSTFALAWYRMGVAALWTYSDSLARRSLEQAARLKGSLSERNGRLVDAMRAMLVGKSREAARLYRSVVTSHPDDVEAWNWLGESQWHYNPLHALPRAASQEAFERVQRLDPGNHESLIHLRHNALDEGRLAEYDSLATLFLERFPDAFEAPVTRVERAFVVGDTIDQRRAIQAMETAGVPVVFIGTYAAAATSKDPGAMERVARLLTDPDRPAGVRAGGHVVRAYARTARGQWREARAELEKAAALDDATALEHRALLSSLPFMEVPRRELETLRARLKNWNPERSPVGERATVFFWHGGLHPHIRSYLLGLADAVLGDERAAVRRASELEALGTATGAGSLPFDLALGVRAEVDRVGDRPGAALVDLKSVKMEVPLPRMHFSPLHSRGRERFLRGVVLDELGRDAEAAKWLGSAIVSPFDLVYRAPSHLRLAHIREEGGDTEAAAGHYARFIELWEDADEHLQDRVEEARQRLAALSDGR